MAQSRAPAPSVLWCTRRLLASSAARLAQSPEAPVIVRARPDIQVLRELRGPPPPPALRAWYADRFRYLVRQDRHAAPPSDTTRSLRFAHRVLRALGDAAADRAFCKLVRQTWRHYDIAKWSHGGRTAALRALAVGRFMTPRREAHCWRLYRFRVALDNHAAAWTLLFARCGMVAVADETLRRAFPRQCPTFQTQCARVVRGYFAEESGAVMARFLECEREYRLSSWAWRRGRRRNRASRGGGDPPARRSRVKTNLTPEEVAFIYAVQMAAAATMREGAVEAGLEVLKRNADVVRRLPPVQELVSNMPRTFRSLEILALVRDAFPAWRQFDEMLLVGAVDRLLQSATSVPAITHKVAHVLVEVAHRLSLGKALSNRVVECLLRRVGDVAPDDRVQLTISLLSVLRDAPSPHELSAALKTCATQASYQLALAIYERIGILGYAPTVDDCNAVVKLAIGDNDVTFASDLLEDFRRRGGQPDRSMLSLAAITWLAIGDVARVEYVVQQMRLGGMPPTMDFYPHLIRAYSDDPAKVTELWHEIQREVAVHGERPGESVCTALVHACRKALNPEIALEVLDTMTAQYDYSPSSAVLHVVHETAIRANRRDVAEGVRARLREVAGR